ncbi:cingulin-like protein 1 isoform X1 [Arapaima gigas]
MEGLMDTYQKEVRCLEKFSNKIFPGMKREHTPEMNGTEPITAGEISEKSEKAERGPPNSHTAIPTKSPAEELTGTITIETHSTTGFDSKAGMQTNRALPSTESGVKLSTNVKNLIHKFSGSENNATSRSGSPTTTESSTSKINGSKTSAEKGISETGLKESQKVQDGNESSQNQVDMNKSSESTTPSITVTPPTDNSPPQKRESREAGLQGPDSATNGNPKTSENNDQVTDSGVGLETDFDPNKQPESPPSEEEPSRAKVSQNPKYQLFLGSDTIGNGSKDADGTTRENGPRNSRWESNSSKFGSTNYRGSLESLASRDWDTMSDKMDSPPRVFNSPYTSPSVDYSQIYRISDCKEIMSPSTSEFNLFGYNSRSGSPVASTSVASPRSRISTYETLTRRREAASSTFSVRPATPSKRDFIEELTAQLDTVQKRNQFLEAESIEMDKERNQIRFEMRGLLVQNGDLQRVNTQLQLEMKKMRERMIELETDSNMMNERLRKQESELKEAREMMVEANTQEYAFNFLQQSLKNKIQDSEEALEKQTEYTQELSEKLWHAERELEEMKAEKQVRDKKTGDLNSTVLRLEAELGEALKAASQADSERSLYQKLKDDAQRRVEELEESLLERTQELQKAEQTISRLQGEVSEKLMDREQTLEEEIQLRERLQLQCKQAERSVEDMQIELQAMAQSKEDLAKQLKQAQEKAIDLESDLEEMLDNEQRWASKHKRTLEQTEQLQLKLIQQKDLNEQLECEKAIVEKQVRELRLEVQELQLNRVPEDVVSRAESKVKELENILRGEERNKMVLTNTIGKLEKKISELTEQLEEENKLATEQKDLMTQRMRSLKRQLNEADEEATRKDKLYRNIQRELAEEREANSRLQRQLLDQNLQLKRKESLIMRQTLESFRLDLSTDGEDLLKTDTIFSKD